MFDIDQIPLNDEKTWDLISSGKTNGVFQCESPLVQFWLSQIKPRNIWELNVIIAGVRPASLQSGAMDRYLEYKLNPDPTKKTGNDIIDSILKSTNYNILFQEQLIQLAERLAWSHIPEMERLLKSDDLRKAVGKKDSAKILVIGKDFVDGCVKNGLNQEIANKLFEVLKNAGRYAFNRSHSIGYAYVSYHTAYLKTHYPKQFFATYLSYSKEKIKPFKELNKLAYDAKRFGIKLLPPNINSKNLEFRIENGNIRYGLNHLKFLDTKTKENIKFLPEINDWRQIVRLTTVGLKLTNGELLKPNSRAIDSLIFSGCLSCLNISRTDLKHISTLLSVMTPKEQAGLMEILDEAKEYTEIPNLITRVAKHVSTKKRKPILESEALFLQKKLNTKDNEFFIEKNEKEYCGTVITGNILGDKEKYSTMKCLELQDSYTTDSQILICVIDSVDIKIIKTGKNKGQKMASLTIHDSSGEIENVMIFSELYNKCDEIIREDAIVQLTLKQTERGFMAKNICLI